ncbi:septation protein IspZ [Myxococcota bacterium]|nr:septation protein IspZ [Myxococcota bacterium]MBU1429067.1 septation protein IspZ [Myxococcota bacterium]MBU1900133.1 septation protein IspZ [Myxococcota bacterium]
MGRAAQTLWAFIPLVLFYFIEARYGLKEGLIAAMAFSALELAWYGLRERRIERAALLSGGLVLLLGGLSLISEDERFILYSPAIGDWVIAAILLYGVWRQRPLLATLAAARDPELVSDPIRRGFLAGLTLRLGLNLGGHGVACIWAAHAPREIWLFVSGPLQYILLGAQLALEFVYARLILLPRLDAWEASSPVRTNPSGSPSPRPWPAAAPSKEAPEMSP